MDKNNFVFDLDDTIAVAISYNFEEKIKRYRKILGKKFVNNHKIKILGYPHMIFPGFYEIFNWIINRGDNLFFFSTGTSERNEKLVKFLIKKSINYNVEEVLKNIKIFSRKDTIKINRMRREEQNKFIPKIIEDGEERRVYGQKKKKLKGVVVSDDELKDTILFDDDISNMVLGEEDNFIKVQSNFSYLKRGSIFTKDDFESFHKAYNIMGLIYRSVKMKKEKNISLVQAFNKFKNLDDNLKIGFKILKRKNKNLKKYFNYEIK